jgi:hypothetical protein
VPEELIEAGAQRDVPLARRLMVALLALAIPAMVLAGAGVNAAVRHLLAPRPTYGAPPATVHPLMVWDGARRQVVMITGSGGRPNPEASTWTWDGSGWLQHASPLQPQVGNRFIGTAAYDPDRRAVVDVVADTGNQRAPADTWVWNGATWTQLLADGRPLVVNGGALAYDDTHHQLVLVGQDPRGPGSLTTWILRGSEWVATQGLADVTGPAQLAYDRSSQRLLLIPTPLMLAPVNPCRPSEVSIGTTTVVGDCFRTPPQPCLGCPVHLLAWEGSAWIPTTMTARYGAVVSDPTGDGLLDLVDSTGAARGVWRWDGRTWSRAARLPQRASVEGWSIAPDPDAHQLVLFGGSESNRGWNPVVNTSDQTWVFDGEGWSMRWGRSLPKLPPPATPPPPPPCTSGAAAIELGQTPNGDVFVTAHIPIAGPPGSCVSVPATLGLDTTTGKRVAVQNNPLDLASLPAWGPSTDFAGARWSNWCGQRTGIVVRFVGTGFDIAKPVTNFPRCQSRQAPSTLLLVRPRPVP